MKKSQLSGHIEKCQCSREISQCHREKSQLIAYIEKSQCHMEMNQLSGHIANSQCHREKSQLSTIRKTISIVS